MSENFITLAMLFHAFLLTALFVSLILHNELQYLSMSTFIILILCNFTTLLLLKLVNS